MTTTTTIGFGDVSAPSNTARLFVIAHVLVTVVIVGTAVQLVRLCLKANRSGD